MQVATFVIAVLALVVSLLSLGWQIFSFSLSGRRVRVYVSVGWHGDGGQMILKEVKKNDDPLDVLSRLSGYGPSTSVLGVTVHNVGRSELYVSAVFITGASEPDTFFPAAGPTWPKLPCLLKPGDCENWYLDTAQLRTLCEQWRLTGDDHKIQLRVGLKDGRTVRVRRKVRITELRKIWNVSNQGGVNGAYPPVPAAPPGV